MSNNNNRGNFWSPNDNLNLFKTKSDFLKSETLQGPVSSTPKLTSKSLLSGNTKGSVTSAPTAGTREKREKTAQGSTK